MQASSGLARMKCCSIVMLASCAARHSRKIAPSAALGFGTGRRSLDRSTGRGEALFPAIRRGACRPARSSRLVPTQAKLSKKYAADAVSAVKLGQVEACKLGQNYAGPEHLLLGILAESDGLPMQDKGAAARLLEASGVTLKQARTVLDSMGGAAGKGLVQQIVEIPLSSKADAALKQSEKEARLLGVPDSVGTEHILAALLGEDQGMACKLLRKMGADVGKLREELLQLSQKKVPAVGASGSADSEGRKGGAAQLAAKLAFLPLAAGAALLQFHGALACAAVAVVVCAAAIVDKHRPNATPIGRVAILTALAAAVGWFGGRLVAAAVETMQPGLRAAAPLVGVVLALGVTANVAK